MIDLYNDDCLSVMQTSIDDESIDVICIDPPYLYLKGQKLERPFNEKLFFSECKRALTKDGFIVMFGRGTSFYRWNTILDELGFNFKEEIIWNKAYTSSPLLPISRIHETVSIFSKGNGVINRNKVPYVEMRSDDIKSVITDINRVASAISNQKSLDSIKKYLNTKEIDFDRINVNKQRLRGDCKDADRATRQFQSFTEGMSEKTIIEAKRDHYSAIHPTQKPVRLLERLLALVIPVKKQRKITIADFFGGSFSTMEAVMNLQKTYPDNEFYGIGCEIDKEYFDAGKKRIEILQFQSVLFNEI